MNEMIQNYIDKRKEEIALEHEREKHQLLENLSIGNKIYSDSNKRTLEFPLYYEYDLNNKAYRIDAADNLSEEDYAELLKYVPKKDKPKTESKEEMSGLYYFAIIMMFIGCIGGIALGVKNKDAVVAIASVLGVLIFFSQIILLCKIEYNTRSKKKDYETRLSYRLHFSGINVTDAIVQPHIQYHRVWRIHGHSRLCISNSLFLCLLWRWLFLSQTIYTSKEIIL